MKGPEFLWILPYKLKPLKKPFQKVAVEKFKEIHYWLILIVFIVWTHGED